MVITAAVAIVVWAVVRLRVVMLPVFVSLILAALLAPAVDLVARRLPRLLATWVVLLTVLLGLVGGGYLLAQPIADATGELSTQSEAVVEDLRDWLQTGPLGLSEERVDSLFDGVAASGERLVSGLADRPASAARMVAEVVGALFLTVVLTFFLLKEGRSLWGWLLGLVRPVRRDQVDVAGRAAFSSLQGWIRGVAITGVVDGILIGAALLILGVPAAIPLAVLTVFAAFFPVVGATLAGALAALVALTANGPTTALIVAGVVLVVQQVEGDVLLPLVMRRQVSLHPIAVLIALAVGGALAGLVGALVAVPVTAGGAAAIRAVHAPTDQPTDEPTSGSPDGRAAVAGGEPALTTVGAR